MLNGVTGATGTTETASCIAHARICSSCKAIIGTADTSACTHASVCACNTYTEHIKAVQPTKTKRLADSINQTYPSEPHLSK